ncbi:unnamed protein product, partial [Mesorhabditis belari]|uniref:DUF7753 domain-containing protein n=1 Tax=Mesorhabditis belari TaxID=2138241 RepID=A0AAF3EF46_9BILA
MIPRKFLLVFLSLPTFIQSQIDCDIRDPSCRDRINRKGQTLRRRVNSNCNYQDIWLIPGRADASCTRPGAHHIIDIQPSNVHIHPDVVKFPGCFTLEIRNLKIHDKAEALGNSFFAKAEFQWWNVKDFSSLKCQNSSSDGCGGYGNNCYYCDICQALTELDEPKSDSFQSQLKGINCPQRPGFYTFRKEFCFNDWTAFDADGDCEMDFLNVDRGDYKGAFASLQQVGYGSVIAKIRMAFNATGQIARKKAMKETQIEETVLRELEERRRTWDVNNGQFDKFRQWYIEYRKNIWHKEDYLPWLIYENEMSCLKLTFDVCERPPRRISFGDRARYTCN